MAKGKTRSRRRKTAGGATTSFESEAGKFVAACDAMAENKGMASGFNTIFGIIAAIMFCVVAATLIMTLVDIWNYFSEEADLTTRLFKENQSVMIRDTNDSKIVGAYSRYTNLDERDYNIYKVYFMYVTIFRLFGLFIFIAFLFVLTIIVKVFLYATQGEGKGAITEAIGESIGKLNFRTLGILLLIFAYGAVIRGVFNNQFVEGIQKECISIMSSRHALNKFMNKNIITDDSAFLETIHDSDVANAKVHENAMNANFDRAAKYVFTYSYYKHVENDQQNKDLKELSKLRSTIIDGKYDWSGTLYYQKSNYIKNQVQSLMTDSLSSDHKRRLQDETTKMFNTYRANVKNIGKVTDIKTQVVIYLLKIMMWSILFMALVALVYSSNIIPFGKILGGLWDTIKAKLGFAKKDAAKTSGGDGEEDGKPDAKDEDDGEPDGKPKTIPDLLKPKEYGVNIDDVRQKVPPGADV